MNDTTLVPEATIGGRAKRGESEFFMTRWGLPRLTIDCCSVYKGKHSTRAPLIVSIGHGFLSFFM